MTRNNNKYIGDEKFSKMLEHYGCPAPLAVVKMRFAGAICSPNLELRPTDVISSFWPEGQSPRLETKEEAELFFKFFMGLWDELFEEVKLNQVKISKIKYSQENLALICSTRVAEIEDGFAEGFWGGHEDLKIPAFLAEVLDSLSDLASVYNKLAKKLDKGTDMSDISRNVEATDKTVEKAIAFIIESSVLPRIDSLQRTLN